MHYRASFVAFAASVGVIAGELRAQDAVPDKIFEPAKGTYLQVRKLADSGGPHQIYLLRYYRENHDKIMVADFALVDHNADRVLETSEIETATYSETQKSDKAEIYVNIARDKLFAQNTIDGKSQQKIESTNPEEISQALDAIKNIILNPAPQTQPANPRGKKAAWGIDNPQI